MSNIYVAVYGSLKRGLHNHSLLAGCEYAGEHQTAPSYQMIDLGHFPGLIEQGSTAIHVEVYGVDSLVLKKMDILEGAPGFYRRTLVDIPLFGKAYVYVLADTFIESLGQQDHLGITSGRWE